MLGSVSLFAGNFAPREFAFCDGGIIAISENQSLYSLLGTFYGGDGRTNFGIPNLSGRCVIGAGSGLGLTPRFPGNSGGMEEVKLLTAQMPAHNHAATAASTAVTTPTIEKEDAIALATSTGTMNAITAGGNLPSPAGNYLAITPNTYVSSTGVTTPMGPNSLTVDTTVNVTLDIAVDATTDVTTSVSTNLTGDSLPHENMPPFQCIFYIIAVQGWYPSRN